MAQNTRSEDSAPESHHTIPDNQSWSEKKFPATPSDDLQPLNLFDPDYKADDVIISVAVSESKGMRWHNLRETSD